MKQKNEKTPLQEIIDFFKSQIEQVEIINETKYNNYKIAEEYIENDIFELLNYTKLLINIQNVDECKNLIETLTILKNNKLINLTEKQIEKIRESNIFKECINQIKTIRKKLEEQIIKAKAKIQKNNEINKMIKELSTLDEKPITEEILKTIFDFIKKHNISKENAIIITKNIMLHNNEIFKKEISLNITENELDTTPQLNVQELIDLFKKYNYDYNIIPEYFKQILLTNGNLKQIDEILNELPKYNIQFDETNKTYLYLIIKSDKEILKKINEITNKYNLSMIELLKKIPAIFLHKTQNHKKIFKNGTNEIGAFEDFIENIELIESIGYDICLSMKNNASIFIQSNKRLKRNVEILKEYGFSTNLKEAGFKLSGLKSTNIEKIIDLFIELNELDYIKQNASRLRLEPDSYIFYRLYFAKKYNQENPKNQIIIKKTHMTQKGEKIVFTGLISDESNTTLDQSIKYDKETFINIIFNEKTDKELKEYIEQKLKEQNTNENIEDEQIIDLDNDFKINDLVYNFNGTIISRKKVKRIYSIIKNIQNLDKKLLLLFAITYNSIISNAEFEKIKYMIISKEKRI